MNINLSKASSIIRNLIHRKELSLQDVHNIQNMMQEINQILFNNPTLKFQVSHDCTTQAGMNAFQSETERILNLWIEFENFSAGNYINEKFAEIYGFFKYVDSEIIYNKVVSHFENLSVDIKEEFISLPVRYHFMNKRLNYKEKDYSLIRQHVDLMCNRVEDYRWLFEQLGDWRSKATLNEIIAYWFRIDLNRLWDLGENIFPDYYDMDLLFCDSNEVFVDCGAFIGDSAIEFINAYGGYKKIYCYELTSASYRQLEENLSGTDNVILRNKGVSNKNQIVYIDERELDQGNSIAKKGSCPAELVALDDDIDEPVTCIKMDIEGAEKDALYGAKNHIINEKPKLLICAYHIPEDIFDIPKIIKDMRDDYTLYLRYDGGKALWTCDYVLYAL